MLTVQGVLSALLVFYMRKFIDIVPPILNFAPGRYEAHRNVAEVSGEMSLSLLYIGVQANAIAQLEKIRYWPLNPPGY
jgi:hypothetical protein